MADRNSALVFRMPTQERRCFVCGDTTDYHIHKCANPECPNWHCLQHSSKTDPQFCEHCVMDITVTESTFQRTDEVYDEVTDTVKITTTRPIKKIELSGVDWVFLQNYFREQNEEELKNTYQIYKAAVSMMENELTQRTIKKMAVTRINDTTVTGNNLSTSTTQAKVKKTKVTKPVDLNGLASTLKKSGMTLEDLKKLLGG